MGDMSHEPSMEDILSSIKRIIADDTEKALSAPRIRKEIHAQPAVDEFGSRVEPVGFQPQPAAQIEPEDVFELTERAPAEDAESALVSEKAALASRSALESLSTIVVKPAVSGSDTLEGMVRDMLRPMLKDWLDANLPQIVEAMVAREIARISGKPLV